MRSSILAACAALASACAAPEFAVAPHGAGMDIDWALAASSGSILADRDADGPGAGPDGGTSDSRGGFERTAPPANMDPQAGAPAGRAVDTDPDLGLAPTHLTFDLDPDDCEGGRGLGGVAVRFDLRSLDSLSGLALEGDAAPSTRAPEERAGPGLSSTDLEALAGSLAHTPGATDVTLFDGHASGRYRIIGRGDRLVGSVVAGVRYVLIDAEYSDSGDEVAGDFAILGPFAGLSLQF